MKTMRPHSSFLHLRTLAGGCLLSASLYFGTPSFGANYSNPVLAGDYPDPSVIRVGGEYWATATTSEWAPLFPLLRSTDLVNWEHAGNVFERRPDWAVGNFWAPEIFEHRGKFFVYYVGRKKGGPLSLAVATADKPLGPWKDHGPLIGQDAGSIDAVPIVNTNGDLYLMWKEDGNSRKQPTPLWIQKLSDDGTKLVGEMKAILRNDTDWERNLVEGPYMKRHGTNWYLFYSGAGCCGHDCSYALGVARAPDLLGPWEKCPKNPLLAGTDQWKCPGHGSIVTDQSGRDWLLYHAYDARTFTYVGRQGLLDLVTWGADGWPEIHEGHGPSTEFTAPVPGVVQQPAHEFSDNFSSVKLRPQWQWPQNNEPRVKVGGGRLSLSFDPENRDAFAAGIVAVKTTTGDYTATTELNAKDLKLGQSAGLSAFGDRENALGVSARDGELFVWKRQRNQQEIISTNTLPQGATVFLRMAASGGHRFNFSASADGKAWQSLGGNIDVEGNYLPPWDRGIRVALVPGGEAASAEFRSLRVTTRP